ncbi:hypothetical protein BC936DRAFT_146076 [Jimgerdemannia flammicorona]|uniref:Uncharacterized protein n=1 Tax=Jimgerdemannia flammicorona TaxID=994334 RepID=A0A433D8E1_9FUNG|nr:hypothetical protein BC936DRAFT_146076 [Jimgerdemannia flammicorona]
MASCGMGLVPSMASVITLHMWLRSIRIFEINIFVEKLPLDVSLNFEIDDPHSDYESSVFYLSISPLLDMDTKLDLVPRLSALHFSCAAPNSLKFYFSCWKRLSYVGALCVSERRSLAKNFVSPVVQSAPVSRTNRKQKVRSIPAFCFCSLQLVPPT